MKELVETIAKALVDLPEEVRVEEVEGDFTSVIKLFVDKEDVGKVIGKRGANANAIRAILEAVGGKYQKRFVLEVVE